MPVADKPAGAALCGGKGPWHFSAVGEPAAGPAGDQVVGEQQDGRSGDGGEPGGQVEEPLQAVDVEQLGSDPAAAQRPGDADQAGDDRPCDLLPGISILASRPAPRPRTIHAMMPITGSLVRLTR